MKTQKTNRISSARTTTHHRKRVGHHQKRTKKFHSVYLPYLPLVVSIVASLMLSGFQPTGNTLAYATDTTVDGLLASTNSERAKDGDVDLTINQHLMSAAQAKANDMVSRNYWSHNTPDGEEPWVFVNNAGYKYLKAGENLAYGFLDSQSTVAGWMNSPSHRANLLDGAFSEVGFGFANSSNYNKSGPETIVVAMYGKPYVLGANQTTPTTAPTPTPTTAAAPSTTQPTETTPVAKPSEVIGFSSDTPGLEPVGATVSRIETLTRGQAPWAVFAVGLILGLSLMAALMKHGLALRRLLANSENFVLHHPLFDSSVVGLIIVSVTLLQTTGVIK